MITDCSFSNKMLIINSNTVDYQGTGVSEENKVAGEQQVVDELPSAQPINGSSSEATDIKVKKTFLRKRGNSNTLINDVNYPSTRNEKSEIAEPCVEELKVHKLHKDLKGEKRRRHFSEGTSSTSQKNERNYHRNQKSMDLGSGNLNVESGGSSLGSSATSLRSSTNKLSSGTGGLGNTANSQSGSGNFDLYLSISNINSNKSINKRHSSKKNINSEPTLKNSESGSSSLKVSITSLNPLSLKKPPRKMRTSASEEVVMQSPNDELFSARKYIDALGSVIKDINETTAPVYKRSHAGFVLKKIEKMKTIDLENCVKKTLEKIKKIADHNLKNMGYEKNILSFDELISLKVQPFEGIITHLEEANWSSGLFNKDLPNQLDVNLALTKNAVEEVKNEISAHLVGKLFSEKLDTNSSSKLTLNDLSFVFPKFITLPQLLLRKVLPALKLNEKLKESTLTNQYLLEFCVKCFENKIGMGGNPETELAELVNEICSFANEEMKAKLKSSYERTVKHAVQMNAAKMSLLFKNQVVCRLEKAINAKPSVDLFKILGFYKFFTKELEKEKLPQQIVSQIAKSIVKKTASEFLEVPLEELLSGKIDDLQICPHYNHMCAAINKLSYIVASEILSYADIGDRRKVIFFYLDVIKECIALGDFASAYSLKMGFEILSISRLRETWTMETKNEWDKEKRNCHKYYGELFDHRDFYKNLLKVMDICKSDYYMMPPPLLGSKLNFIEENLSKKMIMQSQLRRLAREVIIPFQKLQKCLSSLSEDKMLITNEMLDQKLEMLKASIPHEDTLYELSLELEPKKT